jgi:hypothetical protein
LLLAPDAVKHLARHRHVDLFLDTLPYNAHTTASNALWAGVPVLTRLGATFGGARAGDCVSDHVGTISTGPRRGRRGHTSAVPLSGAPILRFRSFGF